MGAAGYFRYHQEEGGGLSMMASASAALQSGLRAWFPIVAMVLPCFASAGDFDAVVRPFLAKYCLACHNATARTAGLDLAAAAAAGVSRDPGLWAKLAGRVEGGSMPPSGLRPSPADRSAVAAAVRDALQAGAPEAVQPAFLRLTNVEYVNSIRDLLGIRLDPSRLLPEDSEGPSGFVNDRGSLLMTDSLMERYLHAAEVAVDSAIAAGRATVAHYEGEAAYRAFQDGKAETIGGVTGFLFSSSRMSKYQTLEQQISVGSPGLYRLRVRARTLRPRLAGGLWFSFDNVGEYRRDAAVLVEGDAWRNYETSIFLTGGDHRLFLGFDYDLPPWISAAGDRPQIKLPADRRELEERQRRFRPSDITWDEIAALAGYRAPVDGDLAAARKLTADLNRYVFDEYYSLFEEARYQMEHGYLPLSTGGPDGILKDLMQPAYTALSQRTGITTAALAALWDARCGERCKLNRAIFAQQKKALQALRAAHDARVDNVFVDWVELEGPLPLEQGSPRLDAESDAQADRTIEQFTRKALRRPLETGEREQLVNEYRAGRSRGIAKPEALRRALVGVLLSPHFLYWVDRGNGRDYDGYTMACRLSRFLYASGPDETLESAAAEGELMSPDGLARQLDRMLDSARSAEFARLFTEQWLDLSAIGRDRNPDSELFREFSWHLAEDMRQEVALDFADVVRGNRSILELLDSRQTWLNERLARLYSIPNVEGIGFRRVTLDDTHRGGLLETAAVLTATSLSSRTSPVYRGKFVLEKLLGQELPPPPPTAGTLPADAGQNVHQTLRETMRAHRSNPACAACHNVLDPIGFGLENYDFVGRWRTRDPGGPIDASGELPGGARFNGAAELKQYLLDQRANDFTRSLACNLLAYALRREIGPADDPIVQRIASSVAADGYRARTLFREVILSEPFRRERSPGGDKR
jgi:hypothetical protein